jgi:hypothetical protein
MWTVLRFALERPCDYPRALELLAHAGFRAHRVPDLAAAALEPLPAAAVADVLQDPAVISRAVFEALQEARLGPVVVTGSQVGPATTRRVAPLARR